MSKCGQQDDHCCYFKGEPCKYVALVDKPPFKWQCVLRTELGSWEAVHHDKRYAEEVRPSMREAGIPVDCGDWPEKVPGARCAECGHGID